jgi:hypothetical protein
MFKKIKNYSVALVTALMMLAPVAIPVTAHAAVSDALCNGISVANGGTVTDPGATNTECLTETATTPNNLIKRIVDFFSLIVGAVSIIMIIYGGFKYITSAGNDSNVGAAKNTILYALIGLIIVALAQVIVRFVLSKATAA